MSILCPRQLADAKNATFIGHLRVIWSVDYPHLERISASSSPIRIPTGKLRPKESAAHRGDANLSHEKWSAPHLSVESRT